MTARGKEEQSKKALNAITAAIIGLIIVIGAYAITAFVFNSVDGGGGAAGTGKVPVHGNCTKSSDCVERASCDEGKCIDNCTIQFGIQGYTCSNTTACDASTIKRNLCSGGNEIVCCQPS